MTCRLHLVLAFLIVPALAAAQSTSAGRLSEGPVVVSSGEGSVKRAPDRAWITVAVESRAGSPREAQKLNAQAMSGVLQKIRGAGLKDDAIQTRAYELQPEYDYHEGRQRLRGYLARNSVEVRVDELSRVGELLDVAVSAGATSVGHVRFDLKDRAGAEREAIRLAVGDARQRAEAAAAGAGMSVGGVLRIEEHRARVVAPPMPMMMEARASAARDVAPPVAPGELEIHASVTLTVALK
jgi:uncharacterized protein YggE